MRVSVFARLAVVLLTGAAATSAFAWEPADKAGIRSVIRQQVQAINLIDARTFAGTVSPELRQRFGNDDNLFGVLMSKVPALETARRIEFGPLRTTSSGLVQMVMFADPDGQPHVSLFVMERRGERWFVKSVAVKRIEASLV